MQHIRPYPVTGQEVIDALGASWKCPYCKCELASSSDDDIGWVPVPVVSVPQRFMCLGCCEDIHSTCASDEFEDHPYVGIVAEAAKIERLPTDVFRSLCIIQQIASGEERIAKEHDVERYGERLERLRGLLNACNM